VVSASKHATYFAGPGSFISANEIRELSTNSAQSSNVSHKLAAGHNRSHCSQRLRGCDYEQLKWNQIIALHFLLRISGENQCAFEWKNTRKQRRFIDAAREPANGATIGQLSFSSGNGSPQNSEPTIRVPSPLTKRNPIAIYKIHPSPLVKRPAKFGMSPQLKIKRYFRKLRSPPFGSVILSTDGPTVHSVLTIQRTACWIDVGREHFKCITITRERKTQLRSDVPHAIWLRLTNSASATTTSISNVSPRASTFPTKRDRRLRAS